MPKEEWKPILDSTYEVSSHGRVRNVKTGRVLKPGSVNGYEKVTPCINNVRKNVLVHVAVAEAFLGPVPDGKEVNHISGNKANNHVDNLEYLTRKENVQHAYDTGLGKGLRGEKSPSAKLTYRQARQIRQRYAEGNTSQAEIAKRYGLSQSAVKNIVNEKTWSKEATK